MSEGEMIVSNGGRATKGGGKSQVGHLLRSAEDPSVRDGEPVYPKAKIRDKVREDAVEANDPDRYGYRARKTMGWKSRKYRYKWEHNLVEETKHKTNRLRKAGKRKSK